MGDACDSLPNTARWFSALSFTFFIGMRVSALFAAIVYAETSIFSEKNRQINYNVSMITIHFFVFFCLNDP